VDDHTLEKLDYQRIREMLAREAQCALGKSLALRIEPSRRQPQIALWLKQANEFAAFVAREGLPPFGGIRDVRENVRRAVPPAKLEPDDFAELAATLNGIDAVREYLARANPDFPDIARIGGRLGDFRTVAQQIDRVIDNRGRVRDDATERLGRIRGEMDTVRQETREVFDRLLKQPSVTKYLQYTNATFHADRMVLPLRSDQRGRVPGIVHRSSDSGQTLFVEPAEAVELNNVLVRLMVEESEEVGRILWELTHLVHVNQAELLKTLETAALIDLLTAKIKLARRYDMHFAELSTEHRLKLTQARNPILLAIFDEEAAKTGQRRDVVPIDVRLGDDFDVMLITGPNTGGKTAALKTVGLIALMFQSGLPIPAAAPSSMPVFDNVFIDVGDEQSLQQNLSTFSAHLARTLEVIRRAHKSTLVLIDEMGAGTDPDEGAAIGKAVVERLLSLGSLAMITTHLGALKALGFEMNRVDNASVQFDLETLRPTYKLCIGEPGNSNALAIASRLGMPRKLVEAAQRHLTRRGRALSKAIAGTLEVRRQAERARMDADKARQDAARATLAAMDRAAELETQQKVYAVWVQRVMSLRPGDVVRVKRFNDTGRVVRMGFEKQQALVAIGAVEFEVPLSELAFD